MAINVRINNSRNFVKEFATFEEGYQELLSLIPDVKLYSGSNPNYNAVIESFTQTIVENVPSPQNPNFPNTLSFSINSREVGFLTDDRLAYGWRIFFNKETAKHTYQFRVTFFAISMSRKKNISLLKENDWSEMDMNNNTRQGRFWNSLTNRNANVRRNNFVTKDDDQDEPTLASNDQLKQLQSTLSEEQQEQSVAEEENTISQETAQEPVIQQTTVIQDAEDEEPKEPSLYAIRKGNLSGQYVVTFYGQDYVIDINSDEIPVGFNIDRDQQIITREGIIYNCLTGEVKSIANSNVSQEGTVAATAVSQSDY